mmetsp:Transcript_32846/g.75618  ORF Transcript_32846/g.75618 Transcript_32846/m.75618 type:complete len:263 (+) Transcript_32846:1198-1986(+)
MISRHQKLWRTKRMFRRKRGRMLFLLLGIYCGVLGWDTAPSPVARNRTRNSRTQTRSNRMRNKDRRIRNRNKKIQDRDKRTQNIRRWNPITQDRATTRCCFNTSKRDKTSTLMGQEIEISGRLEWRRAQFPFGACLSGLFGARDLGTGLAFAALEMLAFRLSLLDGSILAVCRVVERLRRTEHSPMLSWAMPLFLKGPHFTVLFPLALRKLVASIGAVSCKLFVFKFGIAKSRSTCSLADMNRIDSLVHHLTRDGQRLSLSP